MVNIIKWHWKLSNLNKNIILQMNNEFGWTIENKSNILQLRDRSIFIGGLNFQCEKSLHPILRENKHKLVSYHCWGWNKLKFNDYFSKKKYVSYRLLHRSQLPNENWPVPNFEFQYYMYVVSKLCQIVRTFCTFNLDNALNCFAHWPLPFFGTIAAAHVTLIIPSVPVSFSVQKSC